MPTSTNQFKEEAAPPAVSDGQTLSVKRAEVEFHRFASMGEPEAAERMYADENLRREAFLRAHLDFCGQISPFLEIGANVGHTSYLLANTFGCQGYALDISADALRYGMALGQAWSMEREPMRLTGDAERLPFQDQSLAMVCAFQMLSQFQNLEGLFSEVSRVLRPGGVFIFAEEPVRRRLSLRLFRCPYEAAMKPWEKWLHKHGLLGYLVQDVIGAAQEESIGIRQNHRQYLPDWIELVARYFVAHQAQVFPHSEGWAETFPQRFFSETKKGELWGGTLGIVCRKAGKAEANAAYQVRPASQLRCPDCQHAFVAAGQALLCNSCASWRNRVRASTICSPPTPRAFSTQTAATMLPIFPGPPMTLNSRMVGMRWTASLAINSAGWVQARRSFSGASTTARNVCGCAVLSTTAPWPKPVPWSSRLSSTVSWPERQNSFGLACLWCNMMYRAARNTMSN